MIELSLAQNRGENSKDSPMAFFECQRQTDPYSRRQGLQQGVEAVSRFFYVGIALHLLPKEHAWGLTSEGLVTLTGPALAHLKVKVAESQGGFFVIGGREETLRVFLAPLSAQVMGQLQVPGIVAHCCPSTGCH